MIGPDDIDPLVLARRIFNSNLIRTLGQGLGPPVYITAAVQAVHLISADIAQGHLYCRIEVYLDRKVRGRTIQGNLFRQYRTWRYRRGLRVVLGGQLTALGSDDGALRSKCDDGVRQERQGGQRCRQGHKSQVRLRLVGLPGRDRQRGQLIEQQREKHLTIAFFHFPEQGVETPAR